MTRAKKPPLPNKQYTRDVRWIARNYMELSRKYVNKWIAVHKGRVIAVGNDAGRVERLARRRTGAREFPIQFVDDGTIIYALAV